MKRKRKSRCTALLPEACKSVSGKRQKLTSHTHVTHPVLDRYYPTLLNLRQHLLSKLPSSSQKRRQRLLKLGKRLSLPSGTGDNNLEAKQEAALCRLLDTTIIGLQNSQAAAKDLQSKDIGEGFVHFSQAQSLTLGTAATVRSSADADYPDVIDFAVWLLFHKAYSSSRPPHMLCHGLQRATQTNQGMASTIPGLRSIHHNEHLEFVKGPLWAKIFRTLGQGGDAVILDLLLRCGVFVAVESAQGAYYQLSGELLSDMSVVEEQVALTSKAQHEAEKLRTGIMQAKQGHKSNATLIPPAIRFVRHRMLYARPAFNAKGDVSLGLRHIHVLNRYKDVSNREHTVHVMKYIFPRQFGLHNVFTSKVDPKETSQLFKDYTLREKEIAWVKHKKNVARGGLNEQKIVDPVPRRLRDNALELTRRLQRLHGRCSYTRLLAHYCPFPEALREGGEMPHFSILATPVAQVSVFSRAVLQNVVPHGFLGEMEIGEHNWSTLLKNVDTFLRARRFESFSLDDMMRGFKIKGIRWLQPASLQQGQNMALSDFTKRQEIMAELIYYIIDSLLIPLIRSNFHVTESGAYKNRIFYFRHDVWRRMTEPFIADLKQSMYEELGNLSALESLGKTASKASQFRLLPKDKGMRTITNLRRRPQTMQNGKIVLGRSINSTLKPAFTVLNFEKDRRPRKFGGSLFSVGGIYEKIRQFRSQLKQEELFGERLYFVKVDVKSCFDSLPQDKLVRLVKKLLASEEYDILRHAEIKPPEGFQALTTKGAMKPARKFVATANTPGEVEGLTSTLAASTKEHGRHSIFVDGVVPQRVERGGIFAAVEDHIKYNLVKVGKRFYRQKQGIAQGSVLSSMLCNLLFADFERRKLGHAAAGRSVMLRLIDDFLLVTTEKAHAEWFLEVMHGGSTEYGIAVKVEKSLTNFETTARGSQVPQLADASTRFPFCGMMIDTRSLDIFKDDSRFTDAGAIAAAEDGQVRSSCRSNCRSKAKANKEQPQQQHAQGPHAHDVARHIAQHAKHGGGEYLPSFGGGVGAELSLSTERAQIAAFRDCEESSMSLDDMPGSPPDLSSSKSSTKSSSLHSASGNSDDFHNVDNFEDISLNDSAPPAHTTLAPLPTPVVRAAPKQRPLMRSIQTTPTPIRRGLNQSTPNLRETPRASGGLSAHSPNIRSPLSSSPSLVLPPTSGGRSISPRHRQRPLSPRSAISSPNSDTQVSPVLRPRRGSSAQRKRRTAKEIEQDYDSDDEIPEEFLIDNIPFSPRPTGPASGVNSPDRYSTPVPSPSPKMTPADETARAKSWDAALLGLSPSMQELTTKLDDHADEVKRNSDPHMPRPVLSGRSVTLPPVQRGDNLIDPLPPSKEKEKILSRTRPSWLPPKCAKEEKKHLKQYQRIMNDFIAAEKRKSAEAEAYSRSREDREASARRTWEMHILPQWEHAMRDSQRTRELWWAGIPANLRGQVWSRAVGNDLHLSKGSYEAALARARALETRLEAKPSKSSQNHEPTHAEITANARSRRSISSQKADIATAFPEHRLFQEGQSFYLRLRDVLAAYAAYRSDTGHVKGVASIAALLLVHLPEPSATFVTLANLLNRPTSLAFCINDHGAKERTYGRVHRAMKYKTPRLHEHTTASLNIKPDDYLGLLCRSLLTSHLEMAEAARVFDVLVFEGDGVLVRAIVGFLGKNEAHLYGDAKDVCNFLGKAAVDSRSGASGATRGDTFIEWVRWAGKEEGARPQPA
ncbi:hypothetical protein FH972_021073 [Carpinus fangiana]|uniref:Telomerase reverse transcriptase n=1 Tax=Carpinus fangiana TaxID=176857 RepID=A0A5N6KNH0_9ROSI|nr:hypothetical protein FH972_021073 [Carpinus fangiana]